MFLTLLSFTFIITVLVFIHELGHYLAARSVGMRVEKFSVGFPPRFLSFTSCKGGWDFKLFFYKKNEKGKWVWGSVLDRFIKSANKKGSGTEYCLALMPLGGYVKVSGILDESMDPDSTGADYEYQSKKTWQKLWFTSAGVIFNFILSFVIFVFLFNYNGYQKNQIDYVYDKVPNISISNIKVNDKTLIGDDNFFMDVLYVAAKQEDNIQKVVNIDNSKGHLYMRNINAEKINNISFQLPLEVTANPIGGITDSLNIIGDFKNDSSEKRYDLMWDLNANTDVSTQREIYMGMIEHLPIEYPASPAYGKFKSGDRIISVNGKEVEYYKDIAPLIAQDRPADLDPFYFFEKTFSVKLVDIILDQASEEDLSSIFSFYDRDPEVIDFKFERGGVINQAKINPITLTKYDPYGNLVQFNRLGIDFKIESVGFFEAASISFNHTVDSIVGTFKGIFELITGQLSGKAVSGPIGIAKISGEFASRGFIPLLGLMAMLSISLGVINILPFPGLDGGHALIAIIEKVKGSKISAKTQVRIQQFGMLVLMSLFLLIILKDLGFL